MWFHTKKLLKTLKFWKSPNSLCKSGSRPQKSPKKAQKTDHSIAIYSNFLIGMVYFGYHLVNPHVQVVQNMYAELRTAEVDPRFIKKIAIIAVSKKRISQNFWNRTCPLKSLLPLFLLTDRIWSPLANFRRPKHGQNCPATNFCQKAVWSNMHNHHLTFYDPSQYLCCFQITARRVKKFCFSLISLSVRKNKRFGLVYAQFWCHRSST